MEARRRRRAYRLVVAEPLIQVGWAYSGSGQDPMSGRRPRQASTGRRGRTCAVGSNRPSFLGLDELRTLDVVVAQDGVVPGRYIDRRLMTIERELRDRDPRLTVSLAARPFQIASRRATRDRRLPARQILVSAQSVARGAGHACGPCSRPAPGARRASDVACSSAPAG